MSIIFEKNTEEVIYNSIGKKSILITGKTCSGKSELTNYLSSKYGKFNFIRQLRAVNFTGCFYIPANIKFFK